MRGKSKQEEPQSPLDQLLGTFTVQAERMNAIMGFPGVLLLLAIIFVALPSLPGVSDSTGLTVLAAASLVGSVLAYLANWYYSLRRAEANAQVVTEYMQLFLQKYLDSLSGEMRPQDITFAMDYILKPLYEKRVATMAEGQKTVA